ncbi:suppressor of cytokine signaling 4 [Protopterus annectens]|uniref:suppressor of cytokine signaling 4 n=1 Tax=Protopterus annectens TaxID=7888 RepID=UPI001CFB57D4|nr:suppressor of cytokine signaling 4 [Protopterus annectens]XP_043930346.1 suppressor of cytokine signaling 4 [Protopterus annectens]XP_043930347.1 suppressor of cytokine signaling 4 [Protopterus annectens]XP_043930348.1 suppressor of cytokine signaling 4 [Protopterus annectens]
MSEKISGEKNPDVRPKTYRSRSADDKKDGYAWSGKKRSRSSKTESSSDAEVIDSVGKSVTPLHQRERKYSSCSDVGADHSCSRRQLGRSFKQKFQDAVGQCFPIKTLNRHCPPFGSKRKIHISELMLDKCPFPIKSELALRWHLIKRHTIPVSQKNKECVNAEVGLQNGDERTIERLVMPSSRTWRHTCERDGETCSRRCHPDFSLEIEALPSDEENDFESDDEIVTLCASSSRISRPKLELDKGCNEQEVLTKCHTQVDYVHCLVPDLLQINNNPCYWGVMDRYAAEALLEGKPEGTFLLRDSAQEDYLFSVSFRRYSRSLHARIEQWNHSFSFDAHDPCVFHAPDVTGLLEHYKDPNSCMFFEPLLSVPLHRTFPFSLQHLCRTVICSKTKYDAIDHLPVPSSLKTYLKEYHYKHKVRVRRIDQ